MNSQETVIQLRELKLKGMADAFESILSLPVQNRPAMEATIARLAEAEELRTEGTARQRCISRLVD